MGKHPLINRVDLDYLVDLTKDVIEAASVRPGERVGTSPPNSTGGTLIRPGGRDCYPSFWIRDFSMSLDCGLIRREEVRHALNLIAHAQNGPEMRWLASGASIPPWSVPDHINFDGQPVFFPGTYSPTGDQGGEPWGLFPPADNAFEFIHIAYCLHRMGESPAFLNHAQGDLRLLDRLELAFGTVAADPQTALVTTSSDQRCVGFGFCDAIHQTGKLLFPSLLRWRAATELQELMNAVGKTADALGMAREQIQASIPRMFAGPDGWLRAATDTSGQADAWGTAYALSLGLLTGSVESAARAALLSAVRDGTLCQDGAVRHVPRGRGWLGGDGWERTFIASGTYQNGAYWHTPTGWLIQAISPLNAAVAASLVDAMIGHLRTGDFRLGPEQAAPWECFDRDTGHYQNGVYLTSVSVPLASLQQLRTGLH